jgi:hypothetical protein
MATSLKTLSLDSVLTAISILLLCHSTGGSHQEVVNASSSCKIF